MFAKSVLTIADPPIRNNVPLPRGSSRPGEFPWACVVLDGNTDEYVATCVIVPESSVNNDVSVGTRKVITKAHNVKSKRNLKVRVGEFDLRGFRPPETVPDREYLVSRVIVHPGYSGPGRYSNNIAVLKLRVAIDLQENEFVNAACLPKCTDMFGYRFTNQTGTR